MKLILVLSISLLCSCVHRSDVKNLINQQYQIMKFQDARLDMIEYRLDKIEKPTKEKNNGKADQEEITIEEK